MIDAPETQLPSLPAFAAGRRRAWAFWLIAAGLVLRAGYVVRVRTTLPPPDVTLETLDPDGYYRMGAALLESGSLLRDGAVSTEREPGYPIVLAVASFFLGRTPDTGLFLNPFLGILACWILALAAARAFHSPEAGLLTLAFSCLYPEWVYYGGYLYRENLIILLSAAWLWLWVLVREEPAPRRYAALGLIWGYLAITRAPMIPLGGIFLLLEALRLESRLWLRTLGLFLLCGLAVQAPWSWRNYKITGRFVAGSSMGGSMMYLSLLKDYDRPQEPLEAPMHGNDPVIRKVRRKGLTPAEAEPVYYRACRDIMLQQPSRFWGAFLRKVLKLWRPYPHEGWTYGPSYAAIRLVGLFSNGFLFILAAAGAWVARRRGFPLDLWLAFPAAMTVVYGLYWSVTRFHSPLMTGLIPLAALAAAEAWTRRRAA